MAPRICVVGSLVMDLVARAPRFARPGETVLGHSFAAFPGGKGANQAVAAKRLGARVTFVGAHGDLFSEKLLRALGRYGVDTEFVVGKDGPSGVALITVDDDGENAIVMAPGANRLLTADDIAEEPIARADVLLLQLETTAEANARAAEIARSAGTRIVLNAAPAGDELPDHDVLIVNRAEAEALGVTADDRVIVTLGADGAEHAGRRQPSFPVDAIDTVGCGDAFVAAFTVAQAEERENALAFACAAGSLAATQRGAMPSLPTRVEVEALLQ